jgi:hypothetical protein
MSNTKVEVMEAVRAAAVFARLNVPKAAGALALVMVLNVAGGLTSGNIAAAIVLSVLGVLAGVMANGALLRLAFADEHPGDPEFRVGPLGLQFRRTELRLLGAIALVCFFVVLVFLFMLLLMVVVAIATMALGHASLPTPTAQTPLPPEAQAAVSVMLLVFFAMATWVLVRICPYPAATVAEKKVQVFSTWAMTRGAALQIFAAMMLLMVPIFALAMAVSAAHAFPAVQGALSLVFAAVGSFVVGPMLTGLYAHLYRTLRHGAPVTAPPPANGVAAGPWG